MIVMRPCARTAGLACRGALAVLLAASPAFAASPGEGSHTVIANIALCMVSASLLGLAMKVLRQPLILGYILSGVAIGPIGLGLITDESQIVTVSEIGLILLLFMIGLEIDLKKMLSAGRFVIVTGLLQFPLCLLLGLGAFRALAGAGIDLGAGAYAPIYGAIAIAISSTMIVVKLLYDKFELDTLAGRITIGILVFQDIWAIIVLAIQPNLSDPNVVSILGTFAAGGLLVGAALLASRYVLPHVFRSIAKLPELMLVLSLGWCFLVCIVAAHPRVGLSMEMGALIAGVSLATFPYNLDVIAKVISIRDFFITLFFVALGMQIPMPALGPLLVAFCVAAVLLLTRVVGVFGVLYALRAGHRTSILCSINLSQMSEFSLVILTLGIAYGHIERDTLTAAIFAFAGLAVVSTYWVTYSHPLQTLSSRLLVRLGVRDLADQHPEAARQHPRPIALLGFFRIASALFDELLRVDPEFKDNITVVDFNPVVKHKLDALGVPVVYGDVAHPDTLHHAEIHHAKVIVCTIPDAFLKGTSNKKLLRTLLRMCPDSAIIVTAESPGAAAELYEAGAAWVIQPSHLAGVDALEAMQHALAGTLAERKEREAAILDGAQAIV